jgi:polyphosphate kinase 2 (PPK2 family)
MIESVDNDRSLPSKEASRRLEAGQRRLLAAQLAMSTAAVGDPAMPALLVLFEGVDAAGKGGAIRRMVAMLDPRHVRVHAFSAPTPEELGHHFLWRFWVRLPSAGDFAIFDRSWYGRVLVERVEGLCSKRDWQRAYGEIADFERSLVANGTVLVKLWLQIDRREQKKRFEAREHDPLKRWKLTPDDWRNRERWDDYAAAAEKMVERTSTKAAPWTLIGANSKPYARVMVVEAVCDAIEAALDARKVSRAQL